MSLNQVLLLLGLLILVLSFARYFPGFALKRPVALFISIAGLSLAGLLAFFALPVELMPNASFGIITITTPVRGGMSPTDVENSVSKPIEEAVSTVPHIQDIYSNSKEGKSVISIEFVPGTDMEFATLDVREQVASIQAELPREIQHPIIAHYRESDIPVSIFALTSSKKTPEELRVLVEEKLKEDLLRTKGVANVEIAGGRERKIIIDVDRYQLAAQNLDIQTVVSAVEESNQNVRAGAIESNAVTTSIRTMGQYKNVEEIENTIIGLSPQGSVILLKNIASIRDSYMEQESLSRLNTESAVTVYIQKESDANTIEVVKGVNEIRTEFAETLSPDIELIEISNQAKAIQSAIRSVKVSLILGMVLVMMVLGFFLGILPAAAVAISIPLAVLMTAGVMYLQKLSINVMTLSGLALAIGLLVDNSIVVLESIQKKLDGSTKNEPETIQKEATAISPALIGGTLTTIVVFIPFVLLSKNIQILYAGVAITIVAALLFSLYLALTTIPVFTKKIKDGSFSFNKTFIRANHKPFPAAKRLITYFENRYQSVLPRALAHNKSVLLGAVILFCFSIYVFQFHIDKNFAMGDEQSEFIVFVELPSGSRMDLSDKVVKNVENTIRAQSFIMKNVQNITTRIEGWSSKIYVKLKPTDQRDISTPKVISELRPLLNHLGKKEEAFIYFSSPRQGQEILVNIYGPEEKVVADYAMQVSGLMENQPEFTDTKIRYRPGRPELLVSLNPQRTSLFNLTPKQVGQSLHAGTRGLRATYYRDQGNEIETIVRLKVHQRESIDSLKSLTLPSPSGQQISLAQVADFDFQLAPSEIWRHNKERMVQVSSNISDLSLESAGNIADSLMKEIPFNTQYWAEIGGDYHQRLQAQKEFQRALLVTCLLIFAVLACLFESLTIPLILILSLPLAAIGIVGALLVTNTPVTMGVMMGVLLTGGIAVNNAILFIDHFQNTAADSKTTFKDRLLVSGKNRLRPILMTTATTVLGLLPLAVDLSSGAELWRPMAITAIGGLLLSMILTLFILPCFMFWAKEKNWLYQADQQSPTFEVKTINDENENPAKELKTFSLKSFLKKTHQTALLLILVSIVGISHPLAETTTSRPAWVDQIINKQVNELLNKGRQQELEKNYVDAVEYYLEAVSISPENAKARKYLIRANKKAQKSLHKKRNKTKTVYVSIAEDQARATKALSSALEGKVMESRELMEKKKFAESSDMLLRVLETHPTFTPAVKQKDMLRSELEYRLNLGGQFKSDEEKFLTEGFLFYLEGKWNSALESWKTLTDKKSLEKYGQKVQLGAYVAKANRNRLVQERELKIDQYISHGLNHFRSGRLELAQENFNKALELDPSHHQAQQYVAMIPELVEATRQNVLSEVKQQQINTTLSDATEFYLKGFFDQAEEKVQQVLNDIPQHQGALALAADIRDARGLPTLPSLTELKTKEDLKIEGLYSTGILAFAEGRFNDAETAWKSILKLNPNHSMAHRALKKLQEEETE